ncbi:hypothetical protein KY495_01275 [Massilia sp. PAMC28688]|uniref:hypothetical protein n=1 Tax=Massilia sp. PAMC28688 TaxID=2861283 RepID=UPI001C6328EC|nr:hypothetical protein [Massilia sp. PAMC28688]QYF93902.1 hypothetical protein KY495_01275 [Massilia sp. PAMC28688]
MLPPFLARLRLDAGADRRAIRSAYAREVKLIDQAIDPAGFQALRDAYEAALRWAGAPSLMVNELGTPTRRAPDRAHERATETGRLAFARLYQWAAPILQGMDPDRLQALERTLLRALDDEALINLTARAAFQDACVEMLVKGWQPGHEVLFEAATLAFRWEQDSTHLEQSGEQGFTLLLALQEQFIARRQRDFDVRKQHQILTRLRLGRDPEPHFLQRDIDHLRLMQSRLPNLLPIIADRAAIARWHRAWQAIDPGPPEDEDLHNPYRHKARRAAGPDHGHAGQAGEDGDLALLWRICQVIIVFYVIRWLFF